MCRTLGVGVVIKRDNMLLVGRRGPASRKGAGLWALPGGMLDANELVIDCAKREVAEETGLVVDLVGNHFDLPTFAVTDHYPDEPHLTLWLLASWKHGNPEVKEPTKALGWYWVPAPWIGANIEGVRDPANPQYYWLPLPLFERNLSKHFQF